jgi:hypothetical protein
MLLSISTTTIEEQAETLTSCVGCTNRLLEIEMQAKWIALGAVSVLAVSLYSSDGIAQLSTQYQFCLQGDDYPGWSNCSFNSFQQCQASASGTGNECLANPWYQPGAGPAATSPEGSPGADGPIPIGPPPR